MRCAALRCAQSRRIHGGAVSSVITHSHTVCLFAVAATRGAEASAQRNEALKKQAKLLGKATGVNRCGCDNIQPSDVNCEEVTNGMQHSPATANE